MPDLTTTHDSRTCTLGPEGRACGMCEWARKVEEERDKLPPFDAGLMSADGDPDGAGSPNEERYWHS